MAFNNLNSKELQGNISRDLDPNASLLAKHISKINVMLTTINKPIKEISEIEKKRMYVLLKSNYNETNEVRFKDDLSNKVTAILLLDLQHKIQGFTTIGINPNGTGTNEYNIIFSGDTIISPNYWGTQHLARGFTKAVGQFVRNNPSKDCYWLLICKGHRTYMYLPIFCEQFYPCLTNTNEKLKSVLNIEAKKMFGSCWNPKSGLIEFPEKLGELKPALAEGTYKRKNNKHVNFFLQLNPNFHNGVELACIAPINLWNINPRMHRYFYQQELIKL